MFDGSGPGPGISLENPLMKMLQQVSQNQSDGFDPDQMTNLVSQMTSQLLGNQINPEMQESIKNMTGKMVQMMPAMMEGLDGLGGEGDNLTPIPDSKITFDGDVEQKPIMKTKKEFKEPTENEDRYEELDDDDEVDIFKPRTKDIIISLNVTLDEFYKGREKKLAIKRKRIIKDPKTKKEKVIEEKKKIVIPIVPGMRDEQEIRYNKQADELPGYDTGDIVIVLKENNHNFFERDGDNLFVVRKIGLFESYAVAKKLINIVIRTLDGKYLKLEPDGELPLHEGDGLRKLEGFGMPIFKKPGKFGDLYIRFDLVLPKEISDIKQLHALKHKVT